MQDPLVTKGPNLIPLLGIDVWEHAYYLQVTAQLPLKPTSSSLSPYAFIYSELPSFI